MTASTPDELSEAQRIDKWLWCARFFKTRGIAAKYVANASVRVTRHAQTLRVNKASFGVRAEDELCFSIGERLIIVRILSCATRRGPAVEARGLYEDLSPVVEKPKKDTPAKVSGAREPGAGRPTKKQRRVLDRLRGE